VAVKLGFDVNVVALPKGQDPADAPDGFEDRLTKAETYLVHRVRLELARAADRQDAWLRTRAVLEAAEDSPERHEALRIVRDALDQPRETRTGIAPARGATRRTNGAAPPRLPAAGARPERGVPA